VPKLQAKPHQNNSKIESTKQKELHTERELKKITTEIENPRQTHLPPPPPPPSQTQEVFALQAQVMKLQRNLNDLTLAFSVLHDKIKELDKPDVTRWKIEALAAGLGI